MNGLEGNGDNSQAWNGPRANDACFGHVVVVLNPAAGRGLGRRWQPVLAQGLHRALGRECHIEFRHTELDRDAETVAREALHDGADLIVAAGGDGTLHGVVNALAWSGVPVAQIPLGTGNDFARAVGIPMNPMEALEVLRTGSAVPVDLGLKGERYFINAAGCGFDAAVAERIQRGFRRLRGTSAYVAAVIATLLRYRATDMTVTVDGTTVAQRAMLCAVANGRSYGGGMRIAPEARWDDGLLDICVVAACTPLEFLRAFPMVFRGEHLRHPKVTLLRGSSVTVASEPAASVLMDGELCGATPVSFGIAPGALQFVVP